MEKNMRFCLGLIIVEYTTDNVEKPTIFSFYMLLFCFCFEKSGMIPAFVFYH